MIYAELAGGLGNQMFIYAFARALGLRCGEPVTLLDRQDWRDGAPAHTVCALGALNISPAVEILADSGFAKSHLPRQNAAKALMDIFPIRHKEENRLRIEGSDGNVIFNVIVPQNPMTDGEKET